MGGAGGVRAIHRSVSRHGLTDMALSKVRAAEAEFNEFGTALLAAESHSASDEKDGRGTDKMFSY